MFRLLFRDTCLVVLSPVVSETKRAKWRRKYRVVAREDTQNYSHSTLLHYYVSVFRKCFVSRNFRRKFCIVVRLAALQTDAFTRCPGMLSGKGLARKRSSPSSVFGLWAWRDAWQGEKWVQEDRDTQLIVVRISIVKTQGRQYKNRVIKKTLCTCRLQYKNTQKYFKVSVTYRYNVVRIRDNRWR
jgi:hypothetical protein